VVILAFENVAGPAAGVAPFASPQAVASVAGGPLRGNMMPARAEGGSVLQAG
jgi:hypothetical protein